jgi:arsenite methyltransferase
MTVVNSTKMFERISSAPFAATGIRPGGLALTERWLAFAKLPAGSRILDVGCGTGVTVERLAHDHGFQAVGIDSSSMLLAQAKQRNATLPLAMGDAETIPFPDGYFDGAVMECVLSLVVGRERILKECLRVLKPFGKLIITDLYARNPEAIGALRNLSSQSCIKGALNMGRFLPQCTAIGFELEVLEDHSEFMKRFATEIIWTYGSLDRFWTEMGAGCEESACFHEVVRAARLGYFLYVGCKNGFGSEIDEIWREK